MSPQALLVQRALQERDSKNYIVWHWTRPSTQLGLRQPATLPVSRLASQPTCPPPAQATRHLPLNTHQPTLHPPSLPLFPTRNCPSTPNPNHNLPGTPLSSRLDPPEPTLNLTHNGPWLRSTVPRDLPAPPVELHTRPNQRQGATPTTLNPPRPAQPSFAPPLRSPYPPEPARLTYQT